MKIDEDNIRTALVGMSYLRPDVKQGPYFHFGKSVQTIKPPGTDRKAFMDHDTAEMKCTK